MESYRIKSKIDKNVLSPLRHKTLLNFKPKTNIPGLVSGICMSKMIVRVRVRVRVRVSVRVRVRVRLGLTP